MPDDRHRLGGVQFLGNAHGRVGVGEIVALDEGQRPAAHAAARIDLADGELRGAPHRFADRIGKGAGDADINGAFRAAAAGEPGEQQQGQHRHRALDVR